MRNPGLEPGSPYRTLEPESSASTNSASSAGGFICTRFNNTLCYSSCQDFWKLNDLCALIALCTLETLTTSDGQVHAIAFRKATPTRTVRRQQHFDP
jgi:hypothetical protein